MNVVAISLASPFALWALLVLPAVILLYFLRLKRRDVVVSSTLLWSRVLEDKRVNSPFQKFKKSLLLLLQLLALLALVFALARPEKKTELQFARTHLLLVDVSASMAVVEGGSQRLDRARDLAKDYIRGLGESLEGGKERAVVISFAKRAIVESPVTDDTGQLFRALDALDVRPTRTSINEAIELGQSISRNMANEADALAVVFSDGRFPVFEGEEIPMPVEFRPIGEERAANSGIVALASRVDYSKSDAPRVYIEVKNFGPTAVRGVLSMTHEGSILRAGEPEGGIAPGDAWSRSFDAEVEGLVEVVWEPEGSDALESDNRAWIEINPRRQVEIWLVGESNYFLDGALDALGDVSVRQMNVTRAVELLDSEPAPEVMIWNGTTADHLPEGCSHLFIGSVPRDLWPDAQEVESPGIITWDRTHAVNRFLGFGKLVVTKSKLLTQRPGAKSLLDTRGGSLISTFAVPGARGIVVGFDPLDSTWALDISFPLFMHNAVSYLSDTNVGPTVGVRGDDLISFRGRRAVTEYAMLRPDGVRESLEPDSQGWVRYERTDQLGPYRLEWKETQSTGAVVDRVRTIPVNLLDAGESDVSVVSELELAGRKIEGTAKLETTRDEYWPWLLALVLLVLCGEWYCYHLR